MMPEGKRRPIEDGSIETVRETVADECEFIRLSGGETPEVALHESLHQLEAAGAVVTESERRALDLAVRDRYQWMLERDLSPKNRTESFFRGPRRAQVNLGRLHRFAVRTGLDVGPIRDRAARMALDYLVVEADAVAGGRRFNTLGLDRTEMEVFLSQLGLDPGETRPFLDAVYQVETLEFKRAIAGSRAWRKRAGSGTEEAPG
jgi:hypothetical protein